MTAEKTFREACCETLGIAPEDFEEAVLWRCFPPHHLFVGRLWWRFNRGYFANDLDLIQAVADCTNMADLRTELANYRFEVRESGFQRKTLHARMSGQLLVDFASTVLPSRDTPPA
jgi:hypothetical protein